MELQKTISRNIGMMNKLKFFVPERILRTLYCSLVLPYINYGILFWGKACDMYLCKIHKLQKWAMRVISNSHYRSRTASIFQKYNILNVCMIRTSLKWVYLCINTFRFCYLVHLIHSFQNVLIYMIITQEIGVISIKLEIKRSLLIKQSGLQVQPHGIQMMIKLKKAISTNHFRKSVLIDINE